MTKLFWNVKYKEKEKELTIKFNFKEIVDLEYIDLELFMASFNEALHEKCSKLSSFHLNIGTQRNIIRHRDSLQVQSSDPKFLSYFNELFKKINSSSEAIYQGIIDKDVSGSKNGLALFLKDYINQKVIELNKQQGLSFLKLKQNKISLLFILDVKKFELGLFDYSQFKNIFETEAKKQINEFKLSYYPTEKIGIGIAPALNITSTNEKLLTEIHNIFKSLNEHSIYFYDQLNTKKYEFFDELPNFLKKSIEVAILNEKLVHQQTTTKKLKL